MRLSNKLSLLLMVGGMLFLVQSAKAVSVVDRAVIPLTVTTIAIPCTVNVPVEIQLGTVIVGVDPVLSPFNVSVNCTSPLQMEVYMQAVTPLIPGYDNFIPMTGGDSTTQLMMEVAGKVMNLNGDTNLSDTGFCVGSDTRSCEVQPKILSNGNAVTGERTGAIRFNVRYKA